MKILPYYNDVQVHHEIHGWGKAFTEPFMNENLIEVVRVKFYSGVSFEIPISELTYKP